MEIIKNELSWLILGGDGQMGNALRAELGLRNQSFWSLGSKALDISDKEMVLGALQELKPHVVINAAAWTNVDGAEENETLVRETNAFGPQNVAKGCAGIGARFVHFSTDYVFSGDSKVPWSEIQPTSPISVYGKSKAEGEQLALSEYPSGTYVMRTSWLYSQWGSNFVKTMVRLAYGDKNFIEVVGDQVGQPTSAAHLASQVYNLVNSLARPGIYHGSNTGQTTWYEFAKVIFEFIGADSSRIKEIRSEELNRLAARPRYSVLGQENWIREGLAPMSNWRDAFVEVFPAIEARVKLEDAL